MANDILIFGQTKEKSMKAIKELHTLADSFLISEYLRMRINLENNFLIFSKSVGNNKALGSILKISVKSFPVNYLGLPLSIGKLKHADCGFSHLFTWKDTSEMEKGETFLTGKVQLMSWIFERKVNY